MIKIYAKKEGRKISILRTEGVQKESRNDIFRMVYRHMIGIKSKDYKVILEN